MKNGTECNHCAKITWNKSGLCDSCEELNDDGSKALKAALITIGFVVLVGLICWLLIKNGNAA